jgi:hypothetical protein
MKKKSKAITFKATKRKARVIHVDFGSGEKKKAEGMCLKNTSCQKCSDYVIGDPWGSCSKFGYGVNPELAKKQKVCE